MARLSVARERRGLTLKDVSAKTGIPIDLLAALEAEEDAPLAPGGYAERCLMQYEQFLDIEPKERAEFTESEDTSITTGQVHTDPGHRDRVPLVRLVLVGFAFVAIAILGSRLVSLAFESNDRKPAGSTADVEATDLDVAIRASEMSTIEVEVDGVPTFAGDVQPRQVVRYAGKRRISVYIPDLTRVTITYNGSRVEPLGNLSAGRRLVFVDDGT